MKYIAKAQSGSELKVDMVVPFNNKGDAINACIAYAKEEDDFGDFDEEEEVCREALDVRGFYCVGCTTLLLSIEEKNDND